MTKPEEPLVSIIMNCFNGEKYLREAVDSVISQTYLNWELIFWDNQSTDKSAELIKSYNNNRLKYFYAPKHTMLSEARNYAIERASGDFYAFLDVDDWWVNDKLVQQLPLFDNPEVGLVYGNYWFEDELNNTHNIQYKHKLPTGKILEELLKKYIVGLLTIVIRREAYEEMSESFNPKYHVIGDFDLAIRMSVNWEFECVQSPVAHFRWYGENGTKIHWDRQIFELENWHSEMDKHPVVSLSKNFYEASTIKVMYMKAILAIERQKYLDAFKLLIYFPMRIEKLKILIALFLPIKILRLLKKYIDTKFSKLSFSK